MRTILLISLSLILQNCATDRIDRINRVYRIENGTQREITMKFYDFGILRQTKHIIGEGLINQGGATNDAGGVLNPSGALRGADSIVVIFDNQKMQRFYLGNGRLVINPPEGRNIYDDEEYEIINNELYRFVITEQDHENAEDCNGNCE